MFKQKKIYLGMLLGAGLIALTGCSGGSKDNGGITPASPSAEGMVIQNFPLTAVSGINVLFEAEIKNIGSSSISAATNSITISDITYPAPEGITTAIETTGMVGAGADCFDPISNEGATLAPNESCNIVITANNTTGAARELDGNITVSLVNAVQSAITYHISTTFLSNISIISQTGQTPTLPIDPAPVGSDGNIQAGEAWNIAERFTVNGNVVSDNMTGLMWQQNPSNDQINWNDALIRCNNLDQGGYQDWRLPNIIEIASLINLASDNQATTLNSLGFNGVSFANYWSSSSFDNDSAWTMNFTEGYTVDAHKGDDSYAWCVRTNTLNAPAPLWQTGQSKTLPIESPPEGSDGDLQAGIQWNANSRFESYGDTDKVVVDTLTGLMWQQNPGDNESKIWNEAISFCNNYTVTINDLTYDDWRLPNRTELYSLINWAYANPWMAFQDSVFSGVQSARYWTSSTSADDANQAWSVNMQNSIINTQTKASAAFRVWCVRGGQLPTP